jgi:hypothetical protein
LTMFSVWVCYFIDSDFTHQTPKRFLMISLASSLNWTILRRILQELNYLFCTELHCQEIVAETELFSATLLLS